MLVVLPTTAGLVVHHQNAVVSFHRPCFPTPIRSRELELRVDDNPNNSTMESPATSAGELLALLAQRQQLRMPAADQMQYYETTIDAMLD